MFDKMTLPSSTTTTTTATAETEESGGGLGDFVEGLGNSFMQGQLIGGPLMLDPEVTGSIVDMARDWILGGGESEDEPAVCEEEAQECEVEEANEVASEELCEPDALTPEEQLAAAQQAREGLDARVSELQNVTPEQRAVILSRVQGLEGEALVAEMRVITHALESPNADRALNTYADIQTLVEEDDEDRERLTPEVVEMLVNGVADRRTDSDRGQEGVLNRRQALQSARALLDMDDDRYARTMELLHQTGQDADGNAVAGADAGVERSLLLKAVASRSSRLEGHWYDGADRFFGGTPDQDTAFSEIEQFASDIRGTERETLLRTTTTIDIHDANTSTVDPDNLYGPGDTRGDNDGLFQRWGDSCGPTTSQIVRGEADPIYALRLHRGEGINNPDPTSVSAEEQRDTLEDNGGVAVSRLGTQARGQVNTMMDTARTSNAITQDQRDALTRYMDGSSSLGDVAVASVTLATLRAQNGGHPTEEEISAIRNNAGKRGNGMTLTPALERITTPGTGLDYDTVGTANVANNLDDMEARLADGEDVPFRIGYTGGGGHFMTVTDVRRDDAGNRSFLVSDPWSGGTRWVSEADFSSGNFTTGGPDNGRFNLGAARVTHIYTDPSTRD